MTILVAIINKRGASYRSKTLHNFYVLSDPDGIQTHDLQNRNLTLYSAKLRDHTPFKAHAKVMQKA